MVQEHLRRSEELSQKFEKLANKAVRSIKMTAPKQIIEERAKVVRVEGNTAYVHLAGGVDETPVQMTINAEVDDDVLIKRVNGKAWIAGNVTAPPTDDKLAKRADQKASDTYRFTSEVNEKAENAQKIARDGAQYFWFLEEAGDVPTGVGTGAHISEIPKEDFLADPTNGGGNLLARSNGIAVRDGLEEVATFGSDGAQIGRSDDTHMVLSNDGLDIVGKNLYGVEVPYLTIRQELLQNISFIYCGHGTTSSKDLTLDADDFIFRFPRSKSLEINGFSQVVNDPIMITASTGLRIRNALMVDDDITVKNHNSSIGSTNGNSGTANISSASSPYSSVALSGKIVISSGTWMLVGNAAFQANSNGVRYLDWHNDSTRLLHTAVTQQAVAVSGVTTRMQTTAIVSVPENREYAMYLHCYQTSGSTLSVDYNWQIVRIM